VSGGAPFNIAWHLLDDSDEGEREWSTVELLSGAGPSQLFLQAPSLHPPL
jgi:hypothetical protein